MKKCCDTCIRMIGLVKMTPGLEFQGHADCGGNDTVSKLFTECLETVIFSMKSRQSWVEVSLLLYTPYMQLWVLVIKEMEIIMRDRYDDDVEKDENDDACTARHPVQWPGKIRSG